MRQGMVLGALLCTAAAIAGGREPGRENARKQPWHWTVEERLARRFDPLHILERAAAYEQSLTPAQRASHRALEHSRGPAATAADRDPGATIRYGIDGRRDPELFLSHELFDALLTGLAPEPARRARQRQYFEPLLRRAGFDPAAFWPQIESLAGDYLAQKHASFPGSPAARDASCRARHAALEAARRLYGHDRFEQFLYREVAPGKQYSTVTVGHDPVAELRNEYYGCP